MKKASVERLFVCLFVDLLLLTTAFYIEASRNLHNTLDINILNLKFNNTTIQQKIKSERRHRGALLLISRIAKILA